MIFLPVQGWPSKPPLIAIDLAGQLVNVDLPIVAQDSRMKLHILSWLKVLSQRLELKILKTPIDLWWFIVIYGDL